MGQLVRVLVWSSELLSKQKRICCGMVFNTATGDRIGALNLASAHKIELPDL